MQRGLDYTLEYFKRCLFYSDRYDIAPSDKWSDDFWWKNQNSRAFVPNSGFRIIHKGNVEGTIVGGNLCTLNLLQGTEYMPSLKNTILFLEDDEETRPHTFDRDLQSLIHQPGFDGVRGIVIGRFQKASGITEELLSKIISTKKELVGMPIVSNVDFGHTTPQMTFPIGGTVRLIAEKGKIKLTVVKH